VGQVLPRNENEPPREVRRPCTSAATVTTSMTHVGLFSSRSPFCMWIHTRVGKTYGNLKCSEYIRFQRDPFGGSGCLKSCPLILIEGDIERAGPLTLERQVFNFGEVFLHRATLAHVAGS